MFVANVRHVSRVVRGETRREVVTINRRQKKKRANPMVEVVGLASEGIEGCGVSEQPGDVLARTHRLERRIADRVLSAANDLDQAARLRLGCGSIHVAAPAAGPSANRPTSSVRISSRSRPESANANCVLSRPYFSPRLYREPAIWVARYRPR